MLSSTTKHVVKLATTTLVLLFGISQTVDAQCSTDQEVGNNLVVNGDFELGIQTFTTDYPDQLYRFPSVNDGNRFVGYDCATPSRVDATNPVCPDGSSSSGRNFSMPGEYAILQYAHYFHWEFEGTEDPTGGYALYVDGSNTPDDKVWCQDVDIVPNTTYYFSAEVASLGKGTIKAEDVATINFTIDGVTIDQISTSTTVGQWQAATAVWNSGANSGSMPLCFTTASTSGCNACNDFAIDNITFVANCQLGDQTPIPDLGEDVSICGTGAGAVLDPGISDPAVTYEWNTGETSPTITAAAGGTYSVCVKKGTGCIRSDVIEVNADYDISMDDVELCDPPEVELDPGFDGTGVTHTWTGQATGNGPTLTATEAGTYNVEVNDPICGVRNATVEVTSLLVETEDIEYCPGTVTLTATGSTTYNFYENENDATPIGTGATIDVDLSAGGDHTYWVEDAEKEITADVGPTDASFGNNAALDANNKRMKFEVFQEMMIESVKIVPVNYGSNPQVGTIRIFDETNSGAPVHETGSISIPSSAHLQEYEVNVGITLEPGVYYLASSGQINAKFAEGQGVDGAPKVVNDGDGNPIFTTLRPTDNQFDNSYNSVYFFYDWSISTGSGCGRTPLNVIDNCPCLRPEAVISGGSTVCPTDVADDIVINITQGDPGVVDEWLVVYSIDGVDQPQVSTTSTPLTITDPAVGEYELVSVSEVISGTGCAAQTLSGTGEVAHASAPDVVISGDATVCQGEEAELTFNFTGTAPFDLTWSDGTSITVNGVANPHTEMVTATATTTYSIVSVTDASAVTCAGTNASTATVTVTDPIAPQLQGITCNANNTGYVVTIDVPGFTGADFTVTGGTGTVTGSTFVSDEIAEGGNYDFTFTPTSTCDPVVISGSHECACFQPTATIAGGSSVCEGVTPDDVVVTITEGDLAVAAGWTVTYSIDGVAQPEVSVTDPTLTITNPGAGEYVLVSVAEDQGGNQCFAASMTGTGSVEILSPPTVTIDGDANICSGGGTDLEFTIVGDGPFTLTWSDGTTNTTKTGLANPHTETVSPAATTTYSIISVTDAAAPQCPTTDASVATVNVSDPIGASITSTVCNGTATAYTVTIEVTDAVIGEFDVTGTPGTLTGTTFVSDEIIKETTYDFEVVPNSTCPSIAFTGTHLCNCITDAGTVDATAIVACQGEQVTVIHDGAHALDADDDLLFVMHDSPDGTLGNVIAYSTSTTFDYSGDIFAGVTYYISPIAGNANNGVIDITDPCLSVGPGTPVTYTSAPIVELSGSDTICPNGEVFIDMELTGTAPFDVTISNNQGQDQTFTGLVGNPGAISVSPDITTTYAVTNLTDASGSTCPFASLTTVEVVVLPTLQVTTEGHNLTCFEVCETGKGRAFVNVDSEPFVKESGYTWLDENGAVIGTGSSIGDLCAGLYQVSVTNGHCSANALLVIDEPTPVIVQAIGFDPTCFEGMDGRVSAVAGGGSVGADYNYTWSSGAVTSSDTDLGQGTYEIVIADDSACTAVDEVTLIEPEPVEVRITDADITICLGQSTPLEAIGSGGSGTGITYEWTGDASISNPSIAGPTVAPGTDVMLEVVAIDDQGCRSEPANADISLYAGLNVVATQDADILCANEEVTLGYHSLTGGTGGYDLTWTDDNGDTFDAEPAGNAVLLPDLGDYTFTLTAVDQICGAYDGIYTFSPAAITASTLGAPDPSFNVTAIQYCDRVVFDYERESIDNIDNETCQWKIYDTSTPDYSFGPTNCAGTSATFFHDDSKTAELTITNEYGCTSTASVEDLTPTLPNPEVDFTWEPQTLNMISSVATFTPFEASPISYNTYSWDFGDGTTAQEAMPIHEFPYHEAGTYPVTLFAENQFTCRDSITINVDVEGIWALYAPNAFSPGGDGLNDEFIPKHLGLDPDRYEFVIYNRWGDIIFQSFDPGIAWDGTIGGEPAESTVYTWQISAYAAYNEQIQVERTGKVTLIR